MYISRSLVLCKIYRPGTFHTVQYSYNCPIYPRPPKSLESLFREVANDVVFAKSHYLYMSGDMIDLYLPVLELQLRFEGLF